MIAQPVSIVLMAGGPATRLPGKLALDVGGEPMIVRTYRLLRADGWPCIVSLRTPPALASAAMTDCEFAFDEIADAGPLAGLHSAARRVRTPLFFAAAADMPNISAVFVRKLLAAYEAAADPKPAAVLPTWPNEKVEPLAALYDTRAFIAGAARALEAGRRKVTAALDGLAVMSYPVRSEDELALANVNTPADYEKITAP